MQPKAPVSGRKAFTLIELLVVLGILGILAAIVITAIAPSRQLTAATDAWRRSAAREIFNAITQYVVDNGSLPEGIPVGSSNKLPICRLDHAGETTCVDLDSIIQGNYMTALPVDSAESNADLLGFTVYQEPTGFITVEAAYLGVGAVEAPAEGGVGDVCTDNDIDDDGIPNMYDTDSDGAQGDDAIEGTTDTDTDGIPDLYDAV